MKQFILTMFIIILLPSLSISSNEDRASGALLTIPEYRTVERFPPALPGYFYEEFEVERKGLSQIKGPVKEIIWERYRYWKNSKKRYFQHTLKFDRERKLKQWDSLKFDYSGNLSTISGFYYGPNIFFYNSAGNLIKEVHTAGKRHPEETYRYSYNKSGRLTGIEMWQALSKGPYKHTYYTYSYDSRGRCIEHFKKEIGCSSPDCTLKYKIRYNSDNKISDWTRYAYGKSADVRVTVKYDNLSRPAEVSFYQIPDMTRISGIRKFSYNSHGDVERMERIKKFEGKWDPGDNEITDYQYEYDSRGNWTKKMVFKQTTFQGKTYPRGLYEHTERHISYY